jgi:hypothetical protein
MKNVKSDGKNLENYDVLSSIKYSLEKSGLNLLENLALAN